MLFSLPGQGLACIGKKVVLCYQMLLVNMLGAKKLVLMCLIVLFDE